MKIVRVVAAVIRDKNKIFTTQRGYGDFKGGWEFPGGKIEVGETPEQALIREIKEELNADLEVGDLIETIEYDYPNFHLSMDCFWCKLLSPEYTLNEHEAAKWVDFNELNEIDWLEADRVLINTIKKNYKSKCQF